jgi:hypothetical protein
VPKYSANILWWNFEAWECMMQGVQLFRHFTKDDNSKARVLFRKALDLDPNYAMGFVWLAWTYWSDARFHWADAADDALTHPGQGLRAFCGRAERRRVKAAAPYCPWSWPLSRRSTVAAMSGMSLTR